MKSTTLYIWITVAVLFFFGCFIFFLQKKNSNKVQDTEKQSEYSYKTQYIITIDVGKISNVKASDMFSKIEYFS
jgi:preprotein translocase subunit YajC